MLLNETFTVMDIVFGTRHCFGTVNIFAISQQKWLKFGLQAHLVKVFGHAKFQLSISCTFIVMKHLVENTKYTTKNFHNFESTRDRELKFCLSKHLVKMCLETKFQPFRLRNDKDIGCRIDVHGAGMTCTPL